MDYRQFNLVNSLGETYRLTIAARYGAAFIHDITEMGSESSSEFQQIGNQFGIISDRINQKNITGVIRFFQPRAYENYAKFILFAQHKPLMLYYRTPAGEFWRDGIITKIDKSENADVLQATIKFSATSLWYQHFEIDGTTSAEINSESVNQSGCHITITGAMAAPAWAQTIDGETVITGALEDKTVDGNTVSAAISAGESLHIRTDTMPYQIYKIDGNEDRTDMYINSDWSTERFCLIGYGDNEISCAGAESIKVEGRIEYETI